MFALPGYVTAGELVERFSSAIAQKVTMETLFSTIDTHEIKEEYRLSSGALGVGPVNDLLLRRYMDAREIFPTWAMWRVVRERLIVPYLCSQQGIVLRAGFNFFYGPNALAFDDYTFPVEDDTDLADFVDRYREKEESGEFYLVDDGWFICPESWLVRDKDDIIVAIKAQIATDEAEARSLYKRFAETLENYCDVDGKPFYLKLFDEDSVDTSLSQYQEIVRNVSRFSGWSLCFKETEVPTDRDDLLSLVGVNVAARSGTNRDLNSQEIVREIIRMVDAGIPVVRNAVKRSLAANMKEELWRVTWAEASRARPVISRRGPKTGRRKLWK